MKLISFVIPVYNEEMNLNSFHKSIKRTLATIPNTNHELIFVDDGSIDSSAKIIKSLSRKDKTIKLIKLNRNFGKEIATTAGINRAKGAAVMMVDADGQHPVELIPEFLKLWQKGNKLIVGVRLSNKNEGFTKKYGSKIFYGIFNRTSGNKLIPGSTDFRLFDRSIVINFNNLTERNRITRGLIDWLGETPIIVEFNANPRLKGDAGYKFSKLVKLALTSFLSLSFKPLYLIGAIGIIITPLSILVGLFLLVEKTILGDPLNLNVTGSGYLGVFIVFLVGLILISQGLTALYISYIYEEVRNRPLYLIDKEESFY